jgi:hypothetical protein
MRGEGRRSGGQRQCMVQRHRSEAQRGDAARPEEGDDPGGPELG